MSTTISALIIFLVLGSIVACLWLLWWTSRPQPGEEAQGTEKSHVWDGDLRELNNPLPRWWLNLFLISIAFAVVYLVLYPGLGTYTGTLGWSQEAQHDERLAEVNEKRQAHYAQFAEQTITALTQSPAAAQAAGRLFADNCAGCHGPSAQGAIGFPRLTDDDWLYGNDAAQIQQSIAHGRGGVMPAFGAILKADDTSRLLALLQDWNKPRLNAANLKLARTQFSITCAACHGTDGLGNVALGAPNLTDDVWLYGGDEDSLRHTVVFGRHGKMPAHDTILSATEIKLLTAYLLRISTTTP